MNKLAIIHIKQGLIGPFTPNIVHAVMESEGILNCPKNRITTIHNIKNAKFSNIALIFFILLTFHIVFTLKKQP